MKDNFWIVINKKGVISSELHKSDKYFWLKNDEIQIRINLNVDESYFEQKRKTEFNVNITFKKE